MFFDSRLPLAGIGRFGSDGARRAAGLRLAAAFLAVLVLNAASVAPALAGRAPDGREAAGHDRYAFELPNGNSLSFIPLHGPDGVLLGYGVAETVVPENASYLDIRELASADPAEVFNALAPPDIIMPAPMASHYDRPTLGSQGWALDHPIFKKDIIHACSMSAFDDSFPSWLVGQVVSFFDGAASQPSLWQYDSNQADGTWDNHYTVRSKGNLPSYHAKVTRCKKANVQPYYGVPEVRLEAVQGGVPLSIYVGALPMPGATVNYTWQLPNAPNLIMDWKLVVYGTYPGDEFHIGYGWGGFTFG